jgi:hypothetical protein
VFRSNRSTLTSLYDLSGLSRAYRQPRTRNTFTRSMYLQLYTQDNNKRSVLYVLPYIPYKIHPSSTKHDHILLSPPHHRSCLPFSPPHNFYCHKTAQRTNHSLSPRVSHAHCMLAHLSIQPTPVNISARYIPLPLQVVGTGLQPLLSSCWRSYVIYNISLAHYS